MFRFSVGSASDDPIFEQIAFQVRRGIARGELVDGERLPSVRDLARDLVVNPNTVVRAYQALEAEGVLTRRQGSGCFVRVVDSPVRDDVRRRRLEELADRFVTDASMLGCSAREVRTAVADALRDQKTAGKVNPS